MAMHERHARASQTAPPTHERYEEPVIIATEQSPEHRAEKERKLDVAHPIPAVGDRATNRNSAAATPPRPLDARNTDLLHDSTTARPARRSVGDDPCSRSIAEIATRTTQKHAARSAYGESPKRRAHPTARSAVSNSIVG